MANQLTMARINAILTLHQSGHSRRAIARMLGIHRDTVARHLAQNRPNAPTGSETISEAVARAEAGGRKAGPTHDDAAEAGRSQARDAAAKIDGSTTGPADGSGTVVAVGKSGPASGCAAFRDVIVAKMEAGLSAQRIHQDLRAEHAFAGSYWSVRRLVRRLKGTRELPFRRIETAAGEEAQVDFGSAAPITQADGKRQRPWLFRVVLSFSRKGYSEVVWRQSSDAFIACLENAFHHFGGVPKRLVIDNLKAAVAQADWYDPEMHPKLQSFAAHYGTAFMPTKPYTPRHKGKIESGVKYVKGNALKGRVFDSVAAQNQFLSDWESRVADTRIHGTTKRQVAELFHAERPALLPLPVDRFACFQESRRAVHRDGYVEVDKAFYSVPPEYVGRRLWVRWDSRLVRVFNDQWQQLAVHAKADPGRFRTCAEHIPKEKFSAVERGTDALLRQVAAIGPHTGQWADAVVQARGVEAVRVLVGLKALAGKHRSETLEKACEIALSHGAYRLRTIRSLLKRSTESAAQEQFEFIAEHPIIRPLGDYSLDALLDFRRERPHERQTR